MSVLPFTTAKPKTNFGFTGLTGPYLFVANNDMNRKCPAKIQSLFSGIFTFLKPFNHTDNSKCIKLCRLQHKKHLVHINKC